MTPRFSALAERHGAAIRARLSSPSLLDRILTWEWSDDVDGVLDLIRAADPTPTSKYATWLLQTWLRGGIANLTDFGLATEPLTLFTNAKALLQVEKRNINDYKTLNDLWVAVEPFRTMELQSKAARDRALGKQLIETGQAEIYLDTDDVRIVIPKTKEAAQYFGRHTCWCTSAKTDNSFQEYASDTLYIILLKKENRRWQFCFDTAQFEDELSDPAVAVDVKAFVDYFPHELWITAVRKNGAVMSFLTHLDETVQVDALRQNGNAIRYIENPSEAMRLAAVQEHGFVIQFIEDPSEAVQLAAVQQLGSALRFIRDPSEAVQLAAVRQNGDAIRYIPSPSHSIQMEAVQQYGMAVDHIDNPSVLVQLAAVHRDRRSIHCIEKPSRLAKMAVNRQITDLRMLSISDLTSDHQLADLHIHSIDDLISTFG